MSTDFPCCSQDESVEDALQHMESPSGRRTPVVDGDRRLVGMVSAEDLRERMRAVAGGVDAVEDVNTVSQFVRFDEDRLEYMNDQSFPASDPPPPPSLPGGRVEKQ